MKRNIFQALVVAFIFVFSIVCITVGMIKNFYEPVDSAGHYLMAFIGATAVGGALMRRWP